MCYCPIRKILYVHIPKTGGLTLENILVEFYGFRYFTFESNNKYEFLRNPRGKLGIYRYILKYSAESKIYNLPEFFKFSFVRNPYTRSISALRFLHWNCRRTNEEFPNNLEDFYERSKIDNYFYIHFNTTQYDNLLDDERKLTFDYIGRFENFENDLKVLLFDVLKFPIKDIFGVHINKSNDQILELKKEDVWKLTEIISMDDFLNFNYELKNINVEHTQK